MTFVTWKIERTPFNVDTNTWDTGSTEELTQYFDPIVRVNTGDSRDTFQFKVTNTADEFDNYFQTQDKITIYRALNTTVTTTDDILMVGSIQTVPVQEGNNTNLIRVEGFNFSEAVLSGITFVDATLLTIPEAFQAALSQIQTYNKNFQVTWDTGNPSLNSSGGAFPTVNEKWFNKPVRQLLEKFSTSDATKDVNYYWYVDNANHLIWLPATKVPNSKFNSETDEYRSIKISKDTKDVKNWVIAKGGLDPKGRPIQNRSDDIASIAKHGLRYYIIPDISKEGGTVENSDVKDYNGQNGTAFSKMKEADDAGWVTFTPSWSEGTAYATFNAYVDAYRVYVSNLCVEAADSFIRYRRFGKLQLEIEFAPGKGWKLGDLIECTVSQLTKDGVLVPVKSLRVVDIQYSTISEMYTLEEDDGSI